MARKRSRTFEFLRLEEYWRLYVIARGGRYLLMVIYEVGRCVAFRRAYVKLANRISQPKKGDRLFILSLITERGTAVAVAVAVAVASSDLFSSNLT